MMDLSKYFNKIIEVKIHVSFAQDQGESMLHLMAEKLKDKARVQIIFMIIILLKR